MVIISSIETQKKNNERVSIFVNGEFYIGISLYTCKKYKLMLGSNIDDDKLKSILDEENFEEAKNYVTKYCLGKPQKVVQTKLKEKGYEAHIVERIMDYMNRYNFIDDEKYAVAFVKDATRLKKQGSKRIIQSLKSKGIGEDSISRALSVISEEEQLTAAYNRIKSKIPEFKRKYNERDFMSKCYAYLFRNGFNSDIIQKTLIKIENND